MNQEMYLDNTQKSPEKIKTLDELMEKIKKPEELLEFMGANIKYGYVGKKNKKIYTPRDVDFDNDFDKEYFLQSPEQLLNSKHGVCWDQAEFERYWFSKQAYDFDMYFMMFVKEVENNLPTHTFLAYKNNDKFYWFENSFGGQRGIHKYDDLEALINDVKNKHFEHSKKMDGATDEDFKDIKFCKYEEPVFGCDCGQFMDGIIDNNF